MKSFLDYFFCPTCHKAIHYADPDYRKELVARAYYQVRESLEAKNIEISLERLFSYYQLK